MQHKIGFIGAGRAGSALADGLTRAGYTVAAVYSRSADSTARMTERCAPRADAAPSAQAVADACDVVFVTTPDDAIGPVAASLRWGAGTPGRPLQRRSSLVGPRAGARRRSGAAGGLPSSTDLRRHRTKYVPARRCSKA